MQISIATAKRIREEIGATHLIVLALKDGEEAVATSGESVVNAKAAADLGNQLKQQLGWPPEQCNSKPLERVCGNCSYFQPDRGTFYMNSGYDERVYGKCMFDPKPLERAAKDRACHHFEPNA